MRLTSVKTNRESFKKLFVINGYGAYYAGSGRTKTYRYAKNCQYFTREKAMLKQTKYWKLIKVNQSIFIKSFKRHAYLRSNSFKPYVKTVKGKKYTVTNAGKPAYVKIRNRRIVEMKLLADC